MSRDDLFARSFARLARAKAMNDKASFNECCIMCSKQCTGSSAFGWPMNPTARCINADGNVLIYVLPKSAHAELMDPSWRTKPQLCDSNCSQSCIYASGTCAGCPCVSPSPVQRTMALSWDVIHQQILLSNHQNCTHLRSTKDVIAFFEGARLEARLLPSTRHLADVGRHGTAIVFALECTAHSRHLPPQRTWIFRNTVPS